MSILSAQICSNCRKAVPKQCDGRTFSVPGWHRLVCRGTDGEDFVSPKDGVPKFRIVMGHGCSYDVDLTPVD